MNRPALTLLILRLVYEAGCRCYLPTRKGSMFRGAFGHALLALGDETRPEFDLLFGRRPGERGEGRRPYVLTAPPDERTRFAPGDRLEFGLTLLGRARALLPAVRAAAEQAGRVGFGVARARWHLESLTTLDTDSAALVRLTPWSPRARLRLMTPADLCEAGRTARALDAPLLLRRLVGRVGELAEAFGDGDPFDRAAALGEATSLRCTPQGIRLVAWERYSSTAGNRHPLEGLLGTALLEGIAPAAWPYLVLGQWVHVGRGVSFGMGQYALEPEPCATRPVVEKEAAILLAGTAE